MLLAGEVVQGCTVYAPKDGTHNLNKNTMFDYIFFHKTPYEAFLKFLEDKGIPTTTEIDEDSMQVSIPEDIDDDLSDEIDDEYDRLLEMNKDIMDSTDEAEGEFSKVSIDITLKDGTTSKAFVEPELMNRILSVISFDELSDVVQAITDAVETPDDRPYCRRVREANS